MAVAFTEEQQKAITLRHKDILVSAAAGSGKTAVLVERIIRMISEGEHPVDIDRLLVVTFTNAAAAQMRERIGIAIEAKLAQDPTNTHLQRQSTLLHNAKITTIDSFCLFVIRNHFGDIGLDPGFRIGDEGELKLLRRDVLANLLEEQYQQKNEKFLSCVEYFSQSSSDSQLEKYIESLYNFSRSYPWPEDWLLERKNDYQITSVTDMTEQPWCRYLVSYCRTVLKECATQLLLAGQIALQPAGPYYYGEMLEKEAQMLVSAAEKERFEDLYACLKDMKFETLRSKKDESVDAALKDRAKDLRDAVKKQVAQLRERFFAVLPDTAVARMQQAAEPVATLMELVILFADRFAEKKREKNIVDFSDMEHFALEILVRKGENGKVEPTRAAEEYRHYFAEILIDEYQDSNFVQELLLKSISGEAAGNYNRFMVGDVKQSIYRFRLARPELFIEKYNCYSNVDSDRQRIDLHQNFRSRKEVIDSVNHVFHKIMHESLGGIAYDDTAALRLGAVYPDGEGYETELMLTEKSKESEASGKETEAEMIAARIQELHRTLLVTDEHTHALRPVRYSDMVILLRAVQGTAEVFREVLEKAGIPAYVASASGYFGAIEVREILAFLHVLNNPLQDIYLFGTMRSFFGGFTDEEIATIRCSKEKETYLYQDLQAYIADETCDGVQGDACTLRDRVKDFLAKIDRYRSLSAYTPIHKLIQTILTDSGYLPYVTVKQGGLQRLANVEMLLVRAAAFEQTSYYGLFHFLRYIEQLEKYEVDYGEADVLDEHADVVRIMSIHKSKGLEFPVCFVAQLGKRFNQNDTTAGLIADVDMGLGVDCIMQETRVCSRTLRKNAIAMKMKLDSLAEELRILYVAMTRAKEKLILTGTVSNLERTQKQMEWNGDEPLSFSALSSATSYLHFLLPCFKAQQVTFVDETALLSSEITGQMRLMDLKRELQLSKPDNEFMTALSEKWERAYPYDYLKNLYIKTTVSELKKAQMPRLSEESTVLSAEETTAGGVSTADGFTKKLFDEPETAPYIPSFIREEEKMSGTDRGSAYHKVMELLDLPALFQEQADIDAQLSHLVASGKLTETERDAVNERKILDFLNSPIAVRMARAAREGKLYREQPFVLGLPASRMGEDLPDTETVLIQGIIDVFWEEDGKIVVADYKTDRVQGKEELIRRYKVQLEYYAEALERLMGKPVTEKIIYSFGLSAEIQL